MTSEISTPAVQPQADPAEPEPEQAQSAEAEVPQDEAAAVDLTPRGSYVLDALIGENARGGSLVASRSAGPQVTEAPRCVDRAAFAKAAAAPVAAVDKARAEADRAIRAARAHAGLPPAPAPALDSLPPEDSPMARYEAAHEDRWDDENPVRRPSWLRRLLGRRRGERDDRGHRDAYPLAVPPPPLRAPEPSWEETTAHDGGPRIPRFVPSGAELAGGWYSAPLAEGHGTHRRHT